MIKQKERSLHGLRNLGTTIIKRLESIGIHSKEDLKRIGPVKAYIKMRDQQPGKTLPVCYYLYSLEGALQNVHWDNISKKKKEEFLKNKQNNGNQNANVTMITSNAMHNIPADFRKALNADSRAHAVWKDSTPLARNEWICWIISAKKKETRNRRISVGLSKLRSGMRRPCCWSGCPHRKKG